jgi:2-iminoacetate synthase
MTGPIPDWLDATPWLAVAAGADATAVTQAIQTEAPGVGDLAALLSPSAAHLIEPMARRAQALTGRHFGRTISLYVPLYLSDHCSSGCAYCGFASDRARPRRKLEPAALLEELAELKRRGFEEVLLLTGERTPQADYPYLRECVAMAAETFHSVTVEAFPMTTAEYRDLSAVGCSGVTLYQETYDPAQYEKLHRWGPKGDFAARLDAPSRVLESGMRTVGMGVLLGLADPIRDAICLFRHAVQLCKTYWRGGISVSFPRVRKQTGGFAPPVPVDEALLARIIFAFRICLPNVPLVLSTRERPRFRDGIAGIGVSKMSVASRTTVGGYGDRSTNEAGQFEVSDTRDVESFCAMLRDKHLEPVFKNWDAAYR